MTVGKTQLSFMVNRPGRSRCVWRSTSIAATLAGMSRDLERMASRPKALDPRGFNSQSRLPYGLTVKHVRAAMQDFLDFLSLVNGTLFEESLPRLESVLMPANFSSFVGEFMTFRIPDHCPTLAKNAHHNGHPDLVPKGVYADDSVLRGKEGIEIKSSRYLRGWQGHNPEDCFLLVFVFDSNRPADSDKGVLPRPFSFVKVVGSRVAKGDWQFTGRSRTSRRTITATIRSSGLQKMEANWLYRDGELDPDAEAFT